MKNALILAAVLFSGFSELGGTQTTCASYTFSQTPKYDDVSDLSGHSGDHLFAGTATGTCTYSSTGNQYCQVVNSAIGTVEPTDSGELATWPVGYHVSQPSATNGSQTTPYASSGNTANSMRSPAREPSFARGHALDGGGAVEVSRQTAGSSTAPSPSASLRVRLRSE